MTSSWRALTTSTSAGPSCASTSRSAPSSFCGSSTRIALMPIASAMAAKFGFLSVDARCRGSPIAFISSSTKPSVPLLSTITFTGRPIWVRVMKSPIIMVKPPSPDIEITWRPGCAACAPIACSMRVGHRAVVERADQAALAVHLEIARRPDGRRADVAGEDRVVGGELADQPRTDIADGCSPPPGLPSASLSRSARALR